MRPWSCSGPWPSTSPSRPWSTTSQTGLNRSLRTSGSVADSRPKAMSHRSFLLTASLVLAAQAGWAKFARVSEPVPVDRLLANVGAYVRLHPDEAAAHYTLGRIHSLAFAEPTKQAEVIVRNLGAGQPQSLPQFPG